MVNETRLIDLFKTLITINAPSLQERECVDYVKKLLTELGLEHHEDDAGAKIGGNAGNVIAKLPGTKPDAPKIFLSAHFDTVEPTAGIKIIEEGGIIKTDGTTILGADDKAGMAASIEAIRMLQEQKPDHGDVYLLFNVSEECGLMGAGELQLQDLNLAYGYVLDTGPPVGSFVNRTATHDALDVTFIGKPAHAGKHPEDGISAIQVAADAIASMKLGRIAEETTANFGLISGGTGVNVIPAQVTMRGEARSTSVANLDAQIAHMIDCCKTAADKWGAKVEIHHDRHYQAYTIPEDSPVIKNAFAASRACEFVPFLRTTLGGSDANKINALGVPCIVVATGMDKIHTHEEEVSRQSLIDNARLAYELVVTAAKQSVSE
jgi:tripeptide aminopeptidase